MGGEEVGLMLVLLLKWLKWLDVTAFAGETSWSEVDFFVWGLLMAVIVVVGVVDIVYLGEVGVAVCVLYPEWDE